MAKRSIGKLLIVIISIIMIVFCLRLIQWQFIDGEKYQNVSLTNSLYTVKLEAARGEILDVNGEVIAGSKTIFNVVMDALEIDRNRNPALETTLNYMNEHGIKWINLLPIVLDEAGNYQFIENSEKEIEYMKTEMLHLQSYATANECILALTEKYDCENYDKKMALDIISIRYGMTRVNFSATSAYVIAQDVPMNFVEIIKENASEIQGVKIATSSERYYKDGTLLPHIIGTMGLISTEQYDKILEDGNVYSSKNLQGYSYSDVVGKSGIEEAFEDYLRGLNGSLSISPSTETSPKIEEVTLQPTAGNNVYLTIDQNIQEVLNYSLAQNVDASAQPDCVAGAAVVLDVETFGVLASASYPSYDLNLYQSDNSYYTDLLEDEETPLFNRALNGQFTSGSVFKPLVAIAGIEEGVITNGYCVYCDKTYDYYEDYPLSCIGSHDEGYIDLSLAISGSCNSFFCEVGRLLGITKMDVYANLFALGTKTGIEISESSGTMTNPDEYEENHGTYWVDGVTIQAAIGQADSMFTPIQLATYCATIANDGVRLNTHLFSKATTFDNQVITEEYEPIVSEDIGIKQSTMDVVQNSMRETAYSGTASKTFSSYGIAVAAKTGTAQNPSNSDSTTFIAYAPYDDPEIALAVVLEYADNSTLAQNVAKDIFDSYFYEMNLNEIIEAKKAE